MELHEKVKEETKAIEWRDRVQLRPGVNSFPEQVLKTDVLVFEPGADLFIGRSDYEYVAIIAKTVRVQDGRVPSMIRVARKDGTAGTDGRDGQDGAISGKHGEDGAAGEDASAGSTPPPLLIFCEDFSFGTPPNPGVAGIVIDAIGGQGANGGSGGDGGNGKNGFKGWPGFGVGGSICP